MRKYVDENMLSEYLIENFSIFYERFTQEVTYIAGDNFTDVSFDIAKEGYVPIAIFPRTSGDGKIILVGYGFYDESGQGDINLNKVTLTYHNLNPNNIVAGCSIDIHYVKESTFSQKQQIVNAVIEALPMAEEASF